MDYQNTYNHHIPQRALNHLSPIEALQHWRDKSPELFVKRVYKRAELDKYANGHKKTLAGPNEKSTLFLDVAQAQVIHLDVFFHTVA